MNEIFLKRMEELLKEEYPAYLKTLNEPVHRGLRVNTLKISVEQLKKRVPFELKPTKISDTVFEISNELTSLGNSLEHRFGLYYLQEVSAASAVEVLDPKPEEWVLDLCAAPGGKTTQIAMKMQNQGILFANEIENSRAQILLSNCERCGVSNAVITSSTPTALAKVYEGLMDKILVDAPCSGEGMFKKESQALTDWSKEHVLACSNRQKKILEDALKMLKKGGILVYSTCTYSLEENEGVIDYILQNHPEMELLDCQCDFGRFGFDYGMTDGKKVRRIFPMDQGEGHFIAKMQKKTEQAQAKINYLELEKDKTAHSFVKEALIYSDDLYMHRINDHVYLSSFKPFSLKNIKVLRQGIQLGELRKGRLEPHQHFYVSALLENRLSKKLECTEEEVYRFFKGECLNRSQIKGYWALEYQGNVFGFVKADGTVAKNHYPKGLRMR